MARKPKLRGDCVGGPRPCPWLYCRYHLAVEVSRRHPEGFELAETCALDVADRGANSEEYIGELLGYTRQRIQQIEATALKKLSRRLKHGDADLRAFGQWMRGWLCGN